MSSQLDALVELRSQLSACRAFRYSARAHSHQVVVVPDAEKLVVEHMPALGSVGVDYSEHLVRLAFCEQPMRSQVEKRTI